jgi:hypothetical protein
MMETTIVDEKKLEELVDQVVKKHLKLTFENVEEVRRSPAGTLSRIEGRLDAMEARIERDMVTRAEFKAELASTRAELKDEIWKLRLFIILLGILTILTNPKVIELIGKLFSLFKPRIKQLNPIFKNDRRPTLRPVG